MKKLLIVLLACLFMFGLTTTAKALPILTGTQYFSVPTLWNVTINYNVYAPLDASSPLGSIADYSYIYAMNYTSGITKLHTFTIGNPDELTITGAGWVSGVAPNTTTLYSTSTQFGYGSPEFVSGNLSTVYIKSPYQPGMVTGSLQNTGSSDYHPLPGPAIPEPGTMMLLGMGILGLFGLKRKKA